LRLRVFFRFPLCWKKIAGRPGPDVETETQNDKCETTKYTYDDGIWQKFQCSANKECDSDWLFAGSGSDASKKQSQKILKPKSVECDNCCQGKTTGGEIQPVANGQVAGAQGVERSFSADADIGSREGDYDHSRFGEDEKHLKDCLGKLQSEKKTSIKGCSDEVQKCLRGKSVSANFHLVIEDRKQQCQRADWGNYWNAITEKCSGTEHASVICKQILDHLSKVQWEVEKIPEDQETTLSEGSSEVTSELPSAVSGQNSVWASSGGLLPKVLLMAMAVYTGGSQGNFLSKK